MKISLRAIDKILYKIVSFVLFLWSVHASAYHGPNEIRIKNGTYHDINFSISSDTGGQDFLNFSLKKLEEMTFSCGGRICVFHIRTVFDNVETAHKIYNIKAGHTYSVELVCAGECSLFWSVWPRETDNIYLDLFQVNSETN